MRKLFDFECASCKNVQEKLVESTVYELECPLCKSTMYRTLSAPGGFQFKGSGFYHTDFKGK